MSVDTAPITWKHRRVSGTPPHEESDTALVQAVIRRDPGAHERFTQRTARIVESCLSQIRTRSPWLRQESADLAQRFHLMLLEDDCRALATYAGRSALTTWIHVVATRFFHRQAAALKKKSAANQEFSDAEDPAESPEAAQIRRADLGRLRAALAELTADERLLLELFYEQELEAPDVGKILGLTASGARMRKQRLLAKLAKELTP